MPVFHENENRSFELAGNHMTGLATPSRDASHVEVWRANMDAGAATPPHCHDFEEVVVVLRGNGRAQIGGEWCSYREGDTLVLPAGVLHQIFADTATETIAVLPARSVITSADGERMHLPWRE